MDEKFLLKDMFSKDSVGVLAGAILNVHPSFPTDKFINGIFDESWEGLTLKQRMRQISLNLGKTLPEDYHTALEILKIALPQLEGARFREDGLPGFCGSLRPG